MKQIISIHHTAPPKGIKKGFCELYAFGECIWLTREEHAIWRMLENKSSYTREKFVKGLAKQEGKRLK